MGMTKQQAQHVAAVVEREKVARGGWTYRAAGYRQHPTAKDWYVAVYLGPWFYVELGAPEDWPKVKAGELGPSEHSDWHGRA